jgi:SSS family solute:Na+ symporter
MAITFAAALVVLGLMTVVSPLAQPVTLPEQEKIALQSSGGAKLCGIVVVIATLALYWYFF